MPSELNVLLLSNDLFFTSQLHGAIKRAGFQGRTCLSVEGCLKQLENTSPPAIIVDLQTPDLDFSKLRAAAGPDCILIAYGPHVREDLFAAAHAAGVNAILTRGQAVTHVEQILSQLAAKAE